MRAMVILFGIMMMLSCGNISNQEEDSTPVVTDSAQVADAMFFGERIEESGAVDIEGLAEKVNGADSLYIKLKTTINQTCSKKGCWMTVDIGGGQEMMVRFKDYGFFVPLEGMEGKTTVFEGFAFTDSVPVEELRHYALDAGEDSATIAAISEPEVTLAFEAIGVIIRD